MRSMTLFWFLVLVMLVLLAYASYLALGGPLAARAEDSAAGLPPLTARQEPLNVQMLSSQGRFERPTNGSYVRRSASEPNLTRRRIFLRPAELLGILAPFGLPQSIDEALYSIRNCESGGDYATDTGNGYYGAYQFSLETWQAVGGEGYPHLASPQEQDARAGYLLTHYGAGQWPYCGRLI